MTTTTENENYTEVDGMKIQLLKGGSGPTLLVLHDHEVSTEWHEYLEKLSERFTVLVPSHPGFGTSERGNHIESVDDLAYFYLGYLGKILHEHGSAGTYSQKKVNVLGLGLGGWIALEMATKCGHNIDKLVIADSVGIKVSDRETSDISELGILEGAKLLEATWHDPLLGAKIWKRPESQGLSYEEVLALCKGQESALRYAWKPYMHNPKLKGRLGRITSPTLVLWGKSDGIVNTNYGKILAEGIPGAKFEIVPDAGHYPYLEQPGRFVKSVDAFLR